MCPKKLGTIGLMFLGRLGKICSCRGNDRSLFDSYPPCRVGSFQKGFFMEKLRKRVLELLDYNPETGVFTRRVGVHGGGRAGTAAGTLSHGYIRIRIDGKLHSAHRLAFLVSHGHLPDELDHINGDPSDNRIENLRPATSQENKRNTGKQANNTSGFKGVYWDKSNGKWKAQARDANGKQKNIGLFPTPESASAAYEAYVRNLHGEFYRPKNQEAFS